MQSSVNPQELLDMALGVSLVLMVLVLALLAAYLRHRAARGRAERAMDRAQAYIGAILDAAIPGIVVVDDEGVVDAFNLAAEIQALRRARGEGRRERRSVQHGLHFDGG